MAAIRKAEVTQGVYWVEIAAVNLKILCGCPADSVKHLMKRGLILKVEEDGVVYETGPNAILLSDAMVQNGSFSNLSEFPVLQMLYKQGMIIPNHPNNTGEKPLLIGSEAQVNAQMEYIYRGNYGLISEEEIMESGVSLAEAKEMMRMKLKFAFGSIHTTKNLLDSAIVNGNVCEVKDGVTIKRLGVNRFEISYDGESVEVDLNLKDLETYEAPYPLGFYNISREYFSIIHSGQGDGWNINEPCMSSILMFQGKIYLIDAGPNVLHSLSALGISINEIEGLFHTHTHDDHFAGITSLMQSDHKIKYYSSKLVRLSVMKKLSALLGFNEQSFHDFFDVHDLDLNEWTDIEGLEVRATLSPHPVETNIFLFRTMWKNGYRSYAHLADVCSFDILKDMITDDLETPGISSEFYGRIEADYLKAADIKKIDVGGGMIHGQSENFKNDLSGKIILAHTSEGLSTEQKAIGSGAPFGMVDRLIPDYQDFKMRMAYYYLHNYFPAMPSHTIRTLMNNEVPTFNPETILLKEGQIHENVYLVLAGNVEMIQYSQKRMLSAGAFIGEMFGDSQMHTRETYRAVNFVQALQIPRGLYIEAIKKNNLYGEIERLGLRREFLQKTWLFGEAISNQVHQSLAKKLSLTGAMEKESFEVLDKNRIYLIKKGKIERRIDGKKVETLYVGDFFNEEQALFDDTQMGEYYTVEHSALFSIDIDELKNIPVARWKLFETNEKRKKL